MSVVVGVCVAVSVGADVRAFAGVAFSVVAAVLGVGAVVEVGVADSPHPNIDIRTKGIAISENLNRMIPPRGAATRRHRHSP